MSELHVSEALITRVAQEVRALADAANSDLASLDSDLTELLGSGWTGAASSAFGEVWTRWKEGAENVLSGLTSMASALEQAAQQYRATDTSAGAAVDAAGT